jgi:hypothetical protein
MARVVDPATWTMVAALGVVVLVGGIRVLHQIRHSDDSAPLPRHVRRFRRREYRELLATPPLVDLCELHSNPRSNTWVITADTATTWDIYRPGSINFLEDPGLSVECEGPVARFPANHGLGIDPSRSKSGGPPPTLEEIEWWAIPWVEEITGEHVHQLAHGYTPSGEYVVFVQVAPADPRPPRSPAPRPEQTERAPAGGRHRLRELTH